MSGGAPPLLGWTWAEALAAAAARHGDRAAFEFAGPQWHQTLTFAQWRTVSARVAAGLAALGAGAGDRVAVLSPGSAVWPILQTACSHIGAIIVPVNTRYRHDELSHVLGLAEPAVVVFIERYHTTDYLELVTRALAGHRAELVTFPAPRVSLEPAAGPGASPRRDWGELLALGAASPPVPYTGTADDPVLMQLTSGSTAFPKAALLNSRASLGATWYLAQRMAVTDTDIYFSTQPMYHVGGSVATTLMALGAGPVMVVPERYTPEAVFDLIPRYGCTVRTGQAAMYARELAHPDFDPAAFATLRRAWSGGTPELRQAISRDMGVPVMTTIYGLTETAGTTTVNRLDDPPEVWLHSCGRAIPGVEVGVLVDGRVVTTPGVEGEICVRGWSVFLGYYRDPAATAAAFDDERWFHTGDLGRLDAAGNLYFVDRLKDMIKPGGENVSAAEVERVIQALPGIAQVAVVGRRDPRLGEVPVAFVEMRTGHTFDERAIIGHCAGVMASFKVPRAVYPVVSWPLTGSGKILKPALRSRLDAPESRLVGKGG